MGDLQNKLGEDLYDKAMARAVERASLAEKVKAEEHVRQRRQSIGGRFIQGSPSLPKTKLVLPTNADLKFEEEHWLMPIEEMPGWSLHFAVCLKRRIKKLLRKRVTLLYLKMAFIALVSLIIGGMQIELKGSRIDMSIANTLDQLHTKT